MANFNPTGYLPQQTIGMPNFFGFNNAPRVIANQAQIAAMAQAGVHPSINPNAYMPASMMAMNNNPRLTIPLRAIPNPVLKQLPGGYIMLLLLFGEYLANDGNNLLGMHHRKDDIQYWKVFAQFFFAEDVWMSCSLWNNRLGDQKLFELKYPVIPRFYQTFFESGVTSIQLILGSPKEQTINNGCRLDCPKASMVYHYENGSQVVHSGHLIVMFNQTSKINSFEFKTKIFREYIPRPHIPNAIQRNDESLVNDYGIPQKTMRCIEVADGVDLMQEIISMAVQRQLGPRQAFRFIVESRHPSNLNLRMVSRPSETNIKIENEIKNEHSSLIGTSATPISNDIQAPTPNPTPSPSGSNTSNVTIGSPHQKLNPQSPNLAEKRGIPEGVGGSSNKKRLRAGQKASPRK
ncbi:hypothetical protein G9A89_007100 [Geosiphon pyriformis]|nr:hypothetical protein G9A89_007100 [Geosiphon pyriformis]